ncbi:RNA polymerase I-specific transcription initiation factor RRN3-like isoform X2 [Halichondria panicea]
MKPEVKLHGPFFSLCQAVFYVFVFRHKALLDSPDGLKFSRQLNFERVISSRLNPLKVCLPTVVEVFASITNHHEIVFCYSILEQNKRLILSTPVVIPEVKVQQQEQANLLDCYFPFDPYCLKRSSLYVQSLYQEWEEMQIAEVRKNGVQHLFHYSNYQILHVSPVHCT